MTHAPLIRFNEREVNMCGGRYQNYILLAFPLHLTFACSKTLLALTSLILTLSHRTHYKIPQNREKFMYKASIISISDDLIKDVNKLLYGFIWRGNDKIKRTALINDIENGGLKMLDIQSMILSQRIITLKRYIEE